MELVVGRYCAAMHAPGWSFEEARAYHEDTGSRLTLGFSLGHRHAVHARTSRVESARAVQAVRSGVSQVAYDRQGRSHASYR